MPPAKPATKTDEALKALGVSNVAEAMGDLGLQIMRRAAAEAQEPLGQDGPLRGLATGEVELQLADQILRFRCPTFGEWAELGEMLERSEAPLVWWRRASELLGDGPLPADDALPMWLANPIYPHQAKTHWNMRPTQAPGT